MISSSSLVKALRYLPALLASCVLLAVAVPRLHADPVIPSWQGGTSNDVTNPLNWNTGTINAGDSVQFGDSGITTYAPFIPHSGVSLTNIDFTGGERGDYTFSGDAESHSQLLLGGDVTLQSSYGNVVFNQTVDVVLGTGAHAVSVGDGLKLTVAGNVSEAGPVASVVKSGNGTLELSGNNTFNGGVTINAGTLLLGSSALLDVNGTTTTSSPVGFLNLKLAAGTTLGVTSGRSIWLNNGVDLDTNGGAVTIALGSCDSLYLAGNIHGAAELNYTGGGTFTLSGNSDFTGGVAVHGGTLLVGSNNALSTGALKLYDGSSLGVTSGGSITLGNAISLDCSSCSTVMIDLGCNEGLALTGPITGSASLVQSGGTLTLAGANTFDGGMEVQNGATLLIGGTSSVTPRTGDGMMYYDIASSPVGLGVLKLDAGATLGAANSGFYSLYNDIALCGSSTVLIDPSTAGLSLYGYIGGSGGITKKGAGTLGLYDGANDFTGGVTVKNGTLVIGASSHIENEYAEEGDEIIGTHVVGPVGRGTLKFETNCTTPGLALADAGPYTLDNEIDLGCFDGTVNINTGTGATLTLTGYISGYAGITKLGGGTLTLTGDNEFEGDFYVSQGTVNANNNYALGDGALEFGNSTGSTVNFNTNCPVIGGLEGSSDKDVVNLAGVDNVGAHLTIYQNEDSAYAGKIVGAGSVTKENCGTLTLSGASTFSGGFTLAQGELILAGSSYSANGTAIDYSPVGTGDLTLDSGTTLGVLGNGIGILNRVMLPGSGSVTFDAQHATDSLRLDGALVGATDIYKTGLGSLILNHDNSASFTGGTYLNGGTVVANVNGALGTGAIHFDGGALKIADGVVLGNTLDLAAGGTLAGNWAFHTAQSFGSGVTLSPGNSPGTMTFTAGLTLNNGNTFNVEINGVSDNPGTGGSSDLMDVRNSTTHDSFLNVGSLTTHGYTLNIISLDLLGGDVAGAVNGLTGPASWTIFKSDGIVGTFDANNFDLVYGQFYGGGIFALTQVGNDLVLNFTPVPEPSTYALMGLGLCLSGVAAWRKRRRV